MVLSVLSIISGIVQGIPYTAVGSGLLFLFAALMFYGVMKERKVFLVPYMVYQAIVCILYFLLLIFSIVAIASRTSFMGKYFADLSRDDKGNENVAIFAIVFIVIALIQLALAFWFLYIVYTCYKFLKLKDCCGGHSGGQQVVYGAQQTTYGGQAYPAQQVIYTGQPTTTYITTSTAAPRYA